MNKLKKIFTILFVNAEQICFTKLQLLRKTSKLKYVLTTTIFRNFGNILDNFGKDSRNITKKFQTTVCETIGNFGGLSVNCGSFRKKFQQIQGNILKFEIYSNSFKKLLTNFEKIQKILRKELKKNVGIFGKFEKTSANIGKNYRFSGMQNCRKNVTLTVDSLKY